MGWMLRRKWPLNIGLGLAVLRYRRTAAVLLGPKMVVAMLAEIFMVRLEAKPRALQEKLPSSTSQFVPFNKEGQFAFKERNDGLLRLFLRKRNRETVNNRRS
jgi:hypothetical protein